MYVAARVSLCEKGLLGGLRTRCQKLELKLANITISHEGYGRSGSKPKFKVISGLNSLPIFFFDHSVLDMCLLTHINLFKCN